VHNVFHVSQLKKCLRVPEEQIPLGQLDLGGDMFYSKRPIRILDTAERVTHSKIIKMCKVQGSHDTEDEATWEHEEELRLDYPELFLVLLTLKGEIPFKGVGLEHPLFVAIKFWQGRSAFSCILNSLS
jgi:hypothetical protein